MKKNFVASAYQQKALQIQNIITQMQFAPYVVILLFLGRFEKLIIPYIIIPYIVFLLSFIGLRRQTGQKVTAQTPDHCVQWSQTYDQKDKGMVSLSPFWYCLNICSTLTRVLAVEFDEVFSFWVNDFTIFHFTPGKTSARAFCYVEIVLFRCSEKKTLFKFWYLWLVT